MADRLKTLLSATAKLRRRQQRRAPVPSSVTVLDLDGATLRVAQASHHHLKQVATAQLEFAPEADRSNAQVVGAAVKKALANLGLKPASVVMGVGRPRVVLRTLWLPVVENVAELASLVHFQVAKDLPFPPEEAVIDFQIGQQIQSPAERPDAPEKPEEGQSPSPPSNSQPSTLNPQLSPPGPRLEVLVAAVKRDVVEFYQRLALAAGFKLAALGLLPYANARALAACAPALASSDPSSSPSADAPRSTLHAPHASTPPVLALLTLRPDEVSVDVMADQCLVFSRGTIMRAVGETPHIEGAVPVTVEAFVQAAAIEAVRSLHAYGGTEPNRPLAQVLVAGATTYEAALLEALRPRVTVPCAPLEPAAALRLPSDLREPAAGSIGAIGLALGFGDEQGLPFNFLDPKRPAVQRDLRRVKLLAGSAGLVVLLVVLLGVRKVLIDRRTNVLNAATAELADAEKKRPLYRSMINRAGIVGDWAKGGRDWLQHYAYLSSVLPPSEEIYLTALVVDHQGAIHLSVQARSGATLSRLNQQLRQAGYEVKPFAINPGQNRFGYEFRSNVELIPSPKLKIDLTKLKPVARPPDDASLDPKAWRRKGSQ